jgi:hypothetical protein
VKWHIKQFTRRSRSKAALSLGVGEIPIYFGDFGVRQSGKNKLDIEGAEFVFREIPGISAPRAANASGSGGSSWVPRGWTRYPTAYSRFFGDANLDSADVNRDRES